MDPKPAFHHRVGMVIIFMMKWKTKRLSLKTDLKFCRQSDAYVIFDMIILTSLSKGVPERSYVKSWLLPCSKMEMQINEKSTPDFHLTLRHWEDGVGMRRVDYAE
ncbi:Uncharacterized protein Fot_06866 [Forsythia ovata]|uniref:Uncharacterized protein n=1 Tax=Forsythia ovata TaxID=205694 RepID=A0ABD1WUI5_9LAMI